MKTIVTLDVNLFTFPKGLVWTSNNFIYESYTDATYMYPERVLGIRLNQTDSIKFPVQKTNRKEWFKWEGNVSIDQCIFNIKYGGSKEGAGNSTSSQQST